MQTAKLKSGERVTITECMDNPDEEVTVTYDDGYQFRRTVKIGPDGNAYINVDDDLIEIDPWDEEE